MEAKIPVKKVVFRIRKIYFDQIVNGTKTVEVRENKLFWRKRLLNRPDPPSVAAFICGKRKHSRHIASIKVYPSPHKILGRPPSAQGVKDIGTGPVIAIFLGDAYEE